jgi:hypothetical protein
MKMPRMKLYLNFERVLTPAEMDALRELVKRRGQREPLQHIVGSTSFCGFEIAVNRHALVPRPETELLAELGWQFLSTRQLVTHPPAWILAPAPAASPLRSRRNVQRKNHRAGYFGRTRLRWQEKMRRKKVAERIEFLQGDGFAALPAAHNLI